MCHDLCDGLGTDKEDSDGNITTKSAYRNECESREKMYKSFGMSLPGGVEGCIDDDIDNCNAGCGDE